MSEFFTLVSKIVMSLIPGIVFGGVGVGLFFLVLRPPVEAIKILKKGTETTATIVNFDSKFTTTIKSGATSKKEKYYYLTLSFVNSNGEEILYKTKSIYPQQFIRDMKIAKNKTVQVMCLGNKAVVKEYNPADADLMLWAVSVIFGTIGIIFFILAISTIVYYIILLYGTLGTGMYQKYETSRLNTNYNVYFTFKNKYGKTIESKTGLIYKEYEAEALKEMNIFPIKFISNKAVIAVDKSEFLQYKAKKTLQD